MQMKLNRFTPPLILSLPRPLPQDLSKSPKSMKKLLPKRKPERKPSEEEFALRKSTSPFSFYPRELNAYSLHIVPNFRAVGWK